MTKTRDFATHAERAVLQLLARRAFRETGKAVVSPTVPEITLACGARAQLTYEVTPTHWLQRVVITPGPLTESQAWLVAEELTGGPVYPGHHGDGLYEYIRRMAS